MRQRAKFYLGISISTQIMKRIATDGRIDNHRKLNSFPQSDYFDIHHFITVLISFRCYTYMVTLRKTKLYY